MATPTRTVMVSSTMALIATSAMDSAGQQTRIDVQSDYELPAELESQIDAAVGKKNVLEAVNSVFALLVENLG